jgi:hypothetical protein
VITLLQNIYFQILVMHLILLFKCIVGETCTAEPWLFNLLLVLSALQRNELFSRLFHILEVLSKEGCRGGRVVYFSTASMLVSTISIQWWGKKLNYQRPRQGKRSAISHFLWLVNERRRYISLGNGGSGSVVMKKNSVGLQLKRR